MAQPVITGTWLDVVHASARDGVYWNRKTLAYTDEEWGKLIRHLHRDLGVELILLGNVAKDDLAVYPSKILTRQWPTGSTDPVGAIFRACSAEGVQLYAGIGFMAHSEVDHFGSDSPLAAIDWHRRISDEVYERYGQEPSFAGWYVAAEISIFNNEINPAQIEFTRDLADHWRALTPKLPSLASPYWRGELQKSGGLVKSIADTGVDIIAYQDGVGFSTKYHPIDPARNAWVFETFQWIHDQTNIRLWANTELFRFENDIPFQPLLPGPFSRIRTQIQEAAPFVERIVAYTMPGIMTSQEVCPGLGAPETERLHWAYRGYLDGMKTICG